MLGNHKVAGYGRVQQFSNGLQGGTVALNLSQNIAKSMAYIIINQLCGISSKVAACTNQPVTFNGHPKDY